MVASSDTGNVQSRLRWTTLEALDRFITERMGSPKTKSDLIWMVCETFLQTLEENGVVKRLDDMVEASRLLNEKYGVFGRGGRLSRSQALGLHQCSALEDGFSGEYGQHMRTMREMNKEERDLRKEYNEYVEDMVKRGFTDAASFEEYKAAKTQTKKMFAEQSKPVIRSLDSYMQTQDVAPTQQVDESAEDYISNEEFAAQEAEEQRKQQAVMDAMIAMRASVRSGDDAG